MLLLVLLAISYCVGISLNHPHFDVLSDPNFKLDLTKTASAGCPIQPIPVPLNPLPDNIQQAFIDLEQTITTIGKNSSIPGITAIAVYQQQTIWEFNFGVKNIVNKNPTTSNTVFRIGSVSKVFAVLALYRLVQSGVIRSIDDQINHYVPEFSIQNPFSPGSPGITFRQIASQLSGLPRECPCPFICNETSEVMFERIASNSLIWPPLTKASYSNLGFAILGRVIEKIVGMPYEQYVEEFIIQPLNLLSTGFDFTVGIVDEMATGYSGGQPVGLYNLGWSAPAGQMYSSAKDMATLMNFYLTASNFSQNQSIIDPAFLKEMTSPIFVDPNGKTIWGNPWEIQFQNNYLVRRKGGNVPGYSALLSFVPELSLGVSVLFNAQADEFSLASAIYSTLIPAFVSALSTEQPAVRQPPNPQDYVGVYIDPNTSLSCNVLVYKGNMYAVFQFPGTVSFQIQYVTPTNFQVYITPGSLNCLQDDALGLENELVQFQLDENGIAKSITMPNYAWVLVYQR